MERHLKKNKLFKSYIKALIIIVALLFANSSFAQVSNSDKNYFKDNILKLDPLEGIYSSRFFVQERGTGFQKQWTETTELAIKKAANGDLHIISNEQITIRRIGETNAYDVFAKWPAATATCRAYLVNGVSFNYEYRLPEAQLRYNGENINDIVMFGGELIKSYPTASMYADALKKAQEEAKPTEWTGTGFSLKDNYIVTNYHVVDGAKSISVLGINGSFTKGYGAEVIATDKHNDLAILKVYGINIPSANIPYSVKTTTAEVGEEVFVLGYPLTSTMGEEIKLTTGVVSSRSGFQGDVSLYQTTAPIQPGNSGGPLFDSKGNVIGIVSAKHKGAENVGYAIKASYLRNLMESSLPNNVLPQNNKISTSNLSGKVKSAKNFVYYIICSDKTINNIAVTGTTTTNSIESKSSIAEDNYLKGWQNYNSNPEEAVKYFKKAANQGHAKAQYELAGMYFLGRGVTINNTQGTFWLQKAAMQGLSKAQHNLAYNYHHGKNGVKKNYIKAFEWYKKAAVQGEAKSQNSIGCLYSDGLGVKQNYAKAFEWFQKAANQGDTDAQYNLGSLYEDGLGVKKDIQKAIYWYRKAADKNYDDAKEALKRLEK